MGSFKDSRYGDLSGQDITMASLSLADTELEDLEGSPEIFRGDFNMSGNDLVNLKGSPKEIYGYAIFEDNLLESLEGNLKTVVGNLNISNNPLKDFNGSIRKVTGDLFVNKLTEFNTLQEIENALLDANIVVGGKIYCDFGEFIQDPDKVREYSKNQRIGILQRFI